MLRYRRQSAHVDFDKDDEEPSKHVKKSRAKEKAKEKAKESPEQKAERQWEEKKQALEAIVADETKQALAIAKRIVDHNGWLWHDLELGRRAPVIPFFLDDLPYYEPGQAIWDVPDMTNFS